jgi:hypothetical protein
MRIPNLALLAFVAGIGSAGAQPLQAEAISPLAVAGRAPDHNGMTMEELLAREEIRRTLAQDHISGDANDADGYAGAFAEDGVLNSADFDIVGRQAIRDWKAERAKSPPAKFVRHNLTTSQIELTGPDTAVARTYFVVFTEVGPDHNGYYSDQFKKVGDRWLIAHRKVWLDWRAKDSRFRPPPKD